MKSNVGGWDRLARFAVGIAILIIGYSYDSFWGLLGLVFVVTAFIRFCPLYAIFKISTSKGGSCCGGSDDKNGGGCCCGGSKK